MRFFVSLIYKDLLLEVRRKEVLFSSLFIALALCVMIAFGIQNAFVEGVVIYKLFPSLLWIVFILSVAVSLGRSNEYDSELRALDGLLVSGVPVTLIYISKVVVHCLIMALVQALTLLVLPTLLGIDLSKFAIPLMAISFLVIWGYSSLATLLCGMTNGSSIKSLLLPLLLLPLLSPILFAATELTATLLSFGTISIESPWLSLLFGLAIVYFVLGVNLYSSVIKE